MITSAQQAVAVQTRRRQAGKKGRAKAVRRWFQRTYGCAIDVHGGEIHEPICFYGIDDEGDNSGTHRVNLKYMLRGDFTGCRRFDEVHK